MQRNISDLPDGCAGTDSVQLYEKHRISGRLTSLYIAQACEKMRLPLTGKSAIIGAS